MSARGGARPSAAAREPALDGLRAVAAFIVLVSHVWTTALPGGGLGVVLFFALSGYLITTLLLVEARANGRLDLPRFYGRRALRLLPALALLLAVVSVHATLRGHPIQGDLLPVAFYVGNWVRAFGGDLGLLGPTWSLGVEEQFYIVWPVAFLLTIRLCRRRAERLPLALGVVSAAGCLVALGLRILEWSPEATNRIYNGTDTRMDSLLYGCLLGCLLQATASERTARPIAGAAPAGALVIAILVVAEPQGDAGPLAFLYPTVGYALISIAATCVVAGLVLRPAARGARLLAAAPIVWLGTVSYGLYLWQVPVIAALEQVGCPAALLFPAAAGLTVAVAAGSYYCVERPLQRRFRQHLVVAARPVAPGASPAEPDPAPG